MPGLPPVICPPELPSEELQAARLDGEMYALGLGACPIDVVEQPAHRALALAPIAVDRMIAERRTAAWIWGALDELPAPHEFCVDIRARTTRPVDARILVRELVLDASDWVSVGGVPVTTPLRTLVDMARVAVSWDSAQQRIAATLARHAGIDSRACREMLDRSRNLPNKRRAWRRISAALPSRPPLAAQRPVRTRESPGVDPVDVVHRVDAAHSIQDPVQMGRIPHLENELAQR